MERIAGVVSMEDDLVASKPTPTRDLQQLAAIQGASIVVIPPPTVQGMGNGGGWRMMIQDRTGADYAALEAAANELVAAAAQRPEVVGTFSQFSTGAPRSPSTPASTTSG